MLKRFCQFELDVFLINFFYLLSQSYFAYDLKEVERYERKNKRADRIFNAFLDENVEFANKNVSKPCTDK